MANVLRELPAYLVVVGIILSSLYFNWPREGLELNENTRMKGKMNDKKGAEM